MQPAATTSVLNQQKLSTKFLYFRFIEPVDKEFSPKYRIDMFLSIVSKAKIAAERKWGVIEAVGIFIEHSMDLASNQMLIANTPECVVCVVDLRKLCA